MTVAITSDIHLGNQDSRFTDKNGFNPESSYKDFREAISLFAGKKLFRLPITGDLNFYNTGGWLPKKVNLKIKSMRNYFLSITTDLKAFQYKAECSGSNV